ncbi:Transmembrane 9 superfamily member [Seminavis robusta]|uniref:Transmembrane 9 superfamily member n=1 Tax=Seminavis robusta TaxID=568900 RepID=A0A9N8HFY7_9STRA|nr:Transmembrane 9 superfamily member [Seminavis robusta]|eukprot:Sro482_g151770.1 Transmembrane 9 superfamily member (656) ;mRNA; f:13332-15299
MAYYLPGVNIHSFQEGDEIKLKVNKMTSTQTQFPLDYYKFPFCQPTDGVKVDHENLGEFLEGDRIESSPYLLRMKKHMYCEQVCVANLGRGEQPHLNSNKVVKVIRKNYHNNWIVDNLSAASKIENDELVTTRYWQGFPVGFIAEDNKKAYVHNHVNIELFYHKAADLPTGDNAIPEYRIVRFMVEPFSIKHDHDATEEESPTDSTEHFLPTVAKITNPIASCNPATPYNDRPHTSYNMVVESGREPQPASGKALFTYDVIWTEDSNTTWASRWDVYLNMNGAVPAKVHWVSIFNSMVIVFVLSAMIAAILVRNLRRDFARYNKLATDEEKAEDLEEFGWKLVHADVFRPPSTYPMLLAVGCGTGAQILLMVFFTVVFASLGFLNPARRGTLLMAELFLFVMMGGVNGYVTARLYKTFKGKAWQRATTMTAVLFPGISFVFFIGLNILAWSQESTDRVPFTTLLVLIILWFGISTPLVFVGAYFGYKQEAIEFPVNTSSIPRQIPDQPWFMGLPFTLFVGGILPFGSCFVELYYILASVWQEYYYYVFGFLLAVLFILVVTCAEITVLFTYFQLCSENYHWWWRAFGNAGSTAIWVFLYSLVYFQQLEANTMATYFLYFGYTSLVCLGMFCMMGFVGVGCSLWFNQIIFASIKID